MTEHDDLLPLAAELAATLNAYEGHRLPAVTDDARGIRLAPHDDARRCSDSNEHRPWDDVVFVWPGFDARASVRAGTMCGAEVAVVSRHGREVMVRYIATDHRWVVDERSHPDTAAS